MIKQEVFDNAIVETDSKVKIYIKIRISACLSVFFIQFNISALMGEETAAKGGSFEGVSRYQIHLPSAILLDRIAMGCHE